MRLGRGTLGGVCQAVASGGRRLGGVCQAVASGGRASRGISIRVRVEERVFIDRYAGVRGRARVYVRDALKRWVPGATLVSLAVERDGPAITLRVRVREKDVAAAVDVAFDR